LVISPALLSLRADGRAEREIVDLQPTLTNLLAVEEED
jgi:hypothetical protein